MLTANGRRFFPFLSLSFISSSILHLLLVSANNECKFETWRMTFTRIGWFKNFKRISVGKLGTRWKRRYDTLLTHACRREARGRFEKICTTNTPPLWPSSAVPVLLLFQSHVDPSCPRSKCDATLRKRNYSTHFFAFVTRENDSREKKLVRIVRFRLEPGEFRGQHTVLGFFEFS